MTYKRNKMKKKKTKPIINHGWAVYRKDGTIASLHACQKRPRDSVIAWAWKYENPKSEHSGVWLPADYNEAVKRGYKLRPIIITKGKRA